MSYDVNADIRNAIQNSYIEDTRKIIYVKNLKHTKGLEGHWVLCPKYKWPIYIPKRTKDGVPILPADWEDDNENY